MKQNWFCGYSNTFSQTNIYIIKTYQQQERRTITSVDLDCRSLQYFSTPSVSCSALSIDFAVYYIILLFALCNYCNGLFLKYDILILNVQHYPLWNEINIHYNLKAWILILYILLSLKQNWFCSYKINSIPTHFHRQISMHWHVTISQ